MSTPVPPMDITNLSGKSILITGGSSGLGLATTEAFAEAGAYVTIADINPPKEPLEAKNVTYVHCDTTSWDSQSAAFKHAVDFAPSKVLDAVCLYAGVGGGAGSLVDHVLAVPEGTEPLQPNTAAIDVNLKGVLFSAFLALHYFRLNKDAGKGQKSLVFVSSMAGYVDYQPHTTYCAGKFGVRALWRSIRARVGELGVRSNLIAPWYIDSPMTKGIRDYMASKEIKEGEGVRFGALKDVVKAAAIFAGDESVDGRAYAIVPEQPGIIDLGDDLEGKYAGEELVKFLQRSMELGDIEI